MVAHQEFIGAMSRGWCGQSTGSAQGNWKIQKGLIEVIWTTSVTSQERCRSYHMPF
jgi:hypothetical protein